MIPNKFRQSPIDLPAVRVPQRSGLPPCLFIPIAARSTEAISEFVGEIKLVLSRKAHDKAFLVRPHRVKPSDCKLPIWNHKDVSVLVQSEEVWVHVNYTGYRKAYLRAFPQMDPRLVLDHVLNRREARIKGFNYLRVTPIERAVNSSHGGLPERWGVDFHNSAEMRKKNDASKAHIQYADLTNIIKMMNISGGGSLMENYNNAQSLVKVPTNYEKCRCTSEVPHYSTVEE